LKAYIDTSVLVAYYCPEPLSERAETFLLAQKEPAISLLTEVEFFSAVSRKVREKTIEKKDAGKIIAKFISHLDGCHYICLPVERRHFQLARDWISIFQFALRTLDALHLAIGSSEGRTIVTSDPGLFKFAKALTIDTLFIAA
jgi:predicted nucleic acid-binding protein